MVRKRVLVVDDKESVLELMASILGGAYEVRTTPDPREAIALVEEGGFEVVLTDIRMPGASGFDVLRAAKRAGTPVQVVMMTGFASISDAVDAMRQGAFDYVQKPIEADEIALVVARAAERKDLVETPAPVEVDFRRAVVAARDRASREYLAALLRQFGGNVTRAAAQAGMTRESLHRLLRRYDVHSEDFKHAAG